MGVRQRGHHRSYDWNWCAGDWTVDYASGEVKLKRHGKATTTMNPTAKIGISFDPKFTLGNIASILIFAGTFIVMVTQYGTRITASEAAVNEQKTVNEKLTASINALNITVSRLDVTIALQSEAARKNDRWYERPAK